MEIPSEENGLKELEDYFSKNEQISYGDGLLTKKEFDKFLKEYETRISPEHNSLEDLANDIDLTYSSWDGPSSLDEDRISKLARILKDKIINREKEVEQENKFIKDKAASIIQARLRGKAVRRKIKKQLKKIQDDLSRISETVSDTDYKKQIVRETADFLKALKDLKNQKQTALGTDEPHTDGTDEPHTDEIDDPDFEGLKFALEEELRKMGDISSEADNEYSATQENLDVLTMEVARLRDVLNKYDSPSQEEVVSIELSIEDLKNVKNKTDKNLLDIIIELYRDKRNKEDFLKELEKTLLTYENKDHIQEIFKVTEIDTIKDSFDSLLKQVMDKLNENEEEVRRQVISVILFLIKIFKYYEKYKEQYSFWKLRC